MAKIKADKVYTMLVLSNIEYEYIKQLVLNNADLNLEETSNALAKLIESKGITRMFQKDVVQRQCVEHFHLDLKSK